MHFTHLQGVVMRKNRLRVESKVRMIKIEISVQAPTLLCLLDRTYDSLPTSHKFWL